VCAKAALVERYFSLDNFVPIAKNERIHLQSIFDFLSRNWCVAFRALPDPLNISLLTILSQSDMFPSTSHCHRRMTSPAVEWPPQCGDRQGNIVL
jgi:hypothetical protein